MTLQKIQKKGSYIDFRVRRRVVIPIIAGIAGVAAMMVFAFAVTTQPRQGSDLSLTIVREPVNGTVVGTAPNTTGLISQAEAVVIAMRETGLIEETERIEQVYTNWYYVGEDKHVYKVNPQTMELISTEGDMSRIVEKLTNLNTAHYWVIGLETGIDSGYLLVIDASNGDIKDESILYEV
jgi:hypothetical protein